MAGLNKVQIIGRLGGDPEMRQMPNGDAVCSLSLATSETWNDKQTGNRQERTEWHRIVFFGKVAEIAGQYLQKGGQCYVEGMLRTRKWQDKDGIERYTTEIVVDSFNGKLLLLGSPQGGTAGQNNQQPSSQQRQAEKQGQAQRQAPPPNNFDDFSEDIPF